MSNLQNLLEQPLAKKLEGVPPLAQGDYDNVVISEVEGDTVTSKKTGQDYYRANLTLKFNLNDEQAREMGGRKEIVVRHTFLLDVLKDEDGNIVGADGNPLPAGDAPVLDINAGRNTTLYRWLEAANVNDAGSTPVQLKGKKVIVTVRERADKNTGNTYPDYWPKKSV